MGFLTSGKIHEHTLSNIALFPRALNNTNVTGPWHSFERAEKSMKFIGMVGAMAATETIIFQLQQATDLAGTGAKEVSVGEDALFNSATTITANTRILAGTVTCDAVVATNELTIADTAGNSTTITAVEAPATPGAGEYLADPAGDTATATALAAAINAQVPNVLATSAAAVVTVVSLDPEAAALTLTGTAVRYVLATLAAACIIEIEESQLDHANDFRFVALRAQTAANLASIAGALERAPKYRVHRQPVSAITHE